MWHFMLRLIKRKPLTLARRMQPMHVSHHTSLIEKKTNKLDPGFHYFPVSNQSWHLSECCFSWHICLQVFGYI